jgi:hypothetical protein
MPVGVAARSVASAVVVALFTVACGSPLPSTRDEPASRTVLRDGVAVTLALERAATRPGDLVGVLLVVRNVGADPVLWRGNGCALSSPITVVPGAGRRSAEVRGEDPRAALAAALTEGADSPASVVRLRDEAGGGAASCAVDHGFSELAPGAALRYSGAWPARTVLGAPAVSGDYLVRGEFTRLRSDVPLVPAAYRADRDSRPIRVELPLTAAARDAAATGLSGAAAVERLLSHPDLAALTGDRDVWASARLHYRDGVWDLRVPVDRAHVIVAQIADSPFSAPTVRLEFAGAP